MMWEESQGVNSTWNGYLADLPNQFDTLMFWSEDELAELQASTIKGESIIFISLEDLIAVIDKIGRADAERDYMQIVYPIISVSPSGLFIYRLSLSDL